MLFSLVFLASLLAAAAPAAPNPVPSETPAPAPVPAPLPDPPVWLGVYLDDAADGGVQVIGVIPGGPAAQYGVHEGDVLLGVGNVTVLDLPALNRALRQMTPGQRAEFRLLRDGKMETIPLVLGDRARASFGMEGVEAPVPPTPPVRLRPYTIGAELTDIPAELRKHYGAPPDTGVLVVKLDPAGPAAKAGIRVGDVIVRAGQRPVQSSADVLAGLLAASTPDVPFQIVRERKTLTVSMPRPAVPRTPRSAPRAQCTELSQEVERLRARVAELEAEREAEQEKPRE